jgi:DNA repair protein RadC
MIHKETNNASILSQLDNSEKDGMITDEELEEIGVAYGSKEKYRETMRTLAERLSKTTMGRGNAVPVGYGKTGPRITAGTSTVPVGNIPQLKRINIVGKVIDTAGDAAQMFSAFRDPRIEIFNIIYASKKGDVLAHTAWTVGLPAVVPPTYGYTTHEGFNFIQKNKGLLGADKIWVAHNHPSGNPKPSTEDIAATKAYASRFTDDFAGQIILDHGEFSIVFPDGTSVKKQFKEPLRKYVSERRERSVSVHGPEHIAGMFKKVLSAGEDTTALAFLDAQHRVISWVYGNFDDVTEIKNYMRICGGTKTMVLTNNDSVFKNYCSIANRSFNTSNDVFLDVINVDRKTGNFKNNISVHSGNWQFFENRTPKFIVDNNFLQTQMETARKAGYVQGVCECVAAAGSEQNMGKKLLTEMNVTKDMAKKFANPETFKTLEQGIFAPGPEQEQTQSIKR